MSSSSYILNLHKRNHYFGEIWKAWVLLSAIIEMGLRATSNDFLFSGFAWQPECIKYLFASQIAPLHRTNTLDMRSITRCLCSCAVWTGAFSRALWGRGSRRTNCFRTASRKCARRFGRFYRTLQPSVRLKAEKIRPKVPQKMDQEKFCAIEVHRHRLLFEIVLF